VDDRALAHPEVAAELDRFVGTGALRDRVIGWIRAYHDVHGRVTGLTDTVLEPIGAQQTWLMFAGTPPRRPRVMVVEVRPQGEEAYEVFRDGRQWGTGASVGFDYRHRKVQNKLSIRGSPRAREAYARYWADRWNEAQPDRPAAAVRLSYAQLTTRTPAQVRAGRESRPEKTVLSFVLELE